MKSVPDPYQTFWIRQKLVILNAAFRKIVREVVFGFLFLYFVPLYKN
jgi:hypothetical protein